MELNDCSESCRVEYTKRGCTSSIVEGVVAQCIGGGNIRESNHMPSSIPLDVVYLSLKNFKFKFTWDKIHFNNFAKLQCLYISQSEIFNIRDDTFSENFNLNEIIFKDIYYHSNTSLKFIHNVNSKINHLIIENSRNFLNLPLHAANDIAFQKLKSLSLKGNSLKSFPREFYSNFKYLEILDLSNNSLNQLNWTEMNHYLKSLNDLHLDNNALQHISESALPLFLTVNKLYLGYNKYHCNCYLKWLKDFFDKNLDYKTVDDDKVTCSNLNNTVIRKIPDRIFACRIPTIPLISWKQSGNNRIEFNCSSYGDPAPELTIHLTDQVFNGNNYFLDYDYTRTIIIPTTNDSSKLSTISPQFLVGNSLIKCDAKNNVGKATAETLVRSTFSMGSSRTAAATTVGINLIITILIYISH